MLNIGGVRRFLGEEVIDARNHTLPVTAKRATTHAPSFTRSAACMPKEVVGDIRHTVPTPHARDGSCAKRLTRVPAQERRQMLQS
jgi:hypothetical protein